MSSTAARLSLLLGPLRRAQLRVVREAGQLPDLPDAQVEVLRVLIRTDGATPGTIATELGLARSTVSNLLKAMTRAGLIERTLGTNDGRSTVVTASRHARSLLDTYDSASRTVLDAVFARLTPDDYARIESAIPALEALRDTLQGTDSDRDL